MHATGAGACARAAHRAADAQNRTRACGNCVNKSTKDEKTRRREDEKTRSGCRLPPFPPADSIRVPRGPNSVARPLV
jgi:hypothetical protein